MAEFNLDGEPLKPIDLSKVYITVPTSPIQPPPPPNPGANIMQGLSDLLGGAEDVGNSLGKDQ